MLKKSLKCVLAPVILLAAMVSLTSFVESGEGDFVNECRAYLYCQHGAPARCTGQKRCRVGDGYVKCDDDDKVRCPKARK